MSDVPRIPPGPAGNFLTGNLSEFKKDPLGFFVRLQREYGDVALLHLDIELEPTITLKPRGGLPMTVHAR